MHYLIDGYNLLFRILLKGEEVQSAREMMIKDLALKITYTGLQATLVFDSKYQKGEVSYHSEGGLHIVYTHEGETADEWILDAVKRSPQKSLQNVVTTDKRLASQVRVKGALSVSCEEFMGYLGKKVRLKNRSIKEAKAALETSSDTRALSKALPKLLSSGIKKRSYPAKKEADYQEIFEKKLAEEDNQRGVVEKKALRKEKLKREKSIRDRLAGESDNDRWARLFGA